MANGPPAAISLFVSKSRLSRPASLTRSACVPPGDESRRILIDDLIKGKIEMPENAQDIVLLKTDGIPTYHFAHAVDDHLMRTTHVVRGDEWIASLPIHLQLFKMLRL